MTSITYFVGSICFFLGVAFGVLLAAWLGNSPLDPNDKPPPSS